MFYYVKYYNLYALKSKYLFYKITIRVLTPIFPMYYYYDHSFFFEKFYQTFQKSSTVLSQVAGSTKH